MGAFIVFGGAWTYKHLRDARRKADAANVLLTEYSLALWAWNFRRNAAEWTDPRAAERLRDVAELVLLAPDRATLLAALDAGDEHMRNAACELRLAPAFSWNLFAAAKAHNQGRVAHAFRVLHAQMLETMKLRSHD